MEPMRVNDSKGVLFFHQSSEFSPKWFCTGPKTWIEIERHFRQKIILRMTSDRIILGSCSNLVVKFSWGKTYPRVSFFIRIEEAEIKQKLPWCWPISKVVYKVRLQTGIYHTFIIYFGISDCLEHYFGF